jgi:multiple sugar transport system substrate-binding protein
VFKQAGLPTEPDEVEKRTRTWDDVFQLGVDLRKKLPKTALFADAFNDIYTAQVEQQGHGWFDGNKLLFEEKATKPLESAVQARKMGVDANIDWWGAEWHQGLKKQAFCGMMIACWMQTGLTQQDKQTVGKWRVVPPPEGHFNWGGSFLSIPSQGKNKPAAWDFVKYVCCSAQGQNTIFRSTGIFPAYKPAWKDPVYDQPVDFFGGQKTFRLWTELAENVPANVVSKYDVQAGTIISNEITKVEKNNKDPEQAMKDAETAALKQIKGITA